MIRRPAPITVFDISLRMSPSKFSKSEPFVRTPFAKDNVYVRAESRPIDEITTAETVVIELTYKELAEILTERREGELHWRIEYKVNLVFINHVIL